jgi:hypothetical protein
MDDTSNLPQLFEKATADLAEAKTVAEILAVRDAASLIYGTAKQASNLAAAREAANDARAKYNKLMGEALILDAGAMCRIANEYDAAQKRGEVQTAGGNRGNQFGNVSNANNAKPTVTDIGLNRQLIFEARAYRDAEAKEPGFVRKMVEKALAAGEEPTRAMVKREIERINKPEAQKPADTNSQGSGTTGDAPPAQAKPAPVTPAPAEPKIDKEFEERVRIAAVAQCDRLMAEHILPQYDKKVKWAQDMEDAWGAPHNPRGPIPEDRWAEIMMCCHPDSTASAEVRTRVTAYLNGRKKVLVRQKPTRPLPPPLPTIAELRAMELRREAGEAARVAKKASKKRQ